MQQRLCIARLLYTVNLRSILRCDVAQRRGGPSVVCIQWYYLFYQGPLIYSACIKTLYLGRRSCRVVVLGKSLMLNKFSCLKKLDSIYKYKKNIYLCTAEKNI